MDNSNNTDEILAQFLAINPIDEKSARFFLDSSNWDINLALSNSYENNTTTNDVDSPEESDEYVMSAEEDNEELEEEESHSSKNERKSNALQEEAPRRSSRLGAQASTQKYNTRNSRINTLDFESEDDSEDRQDYFAGGEKSGVAIRGPGAEGEPDSSLVEKLIKKAQEYMKSSQNQNTENVATGSSFIGKGRSLDSSSTNADNLAQNDGNPDEPVYRNLSIWRNGFNFDDGKLHNFDDPNSQLLLDNILQGRAPLDVLNVKQGQAVELRITKRSDEDYSEEPKKRQVFSGSGHRLGAITSTIKVNSISDEYTSNAATSSSQNVSSTKPLVVDEDQPTTQLQIRLVDGSRIVIKVNLTHRVVDIMDEIEAMHSNPTNGREFILKVAFPSKILDKNSTVEEANLKNSVLVQQLV
ncbi:hypothetical protein BB561_001782 [Smittium simulii]|uniref:SEP domain-containing protein n=1 Tax=Smittium simulii TaxID=133385 RepID=A0A2T9YT09_9FUNG|nr:hypothetical protein BB561_001782 [Smittium simulii]